MYQGKDFTVIDKVTQKRRSQMSETLSKSLALWSRQCGTISNGIPFKMKAVSANAESVPTSRP